MRRYGNPDDRACSAPALMGPDCLNSGILSLISVQGRLPLQRRTSNAKTAVVRLRQEEGIEAGESASLIGAVGLPRKPVSDVAETVREPLERAVDAEVGLPDDQKETEKQNAVGRCRREQVHHPRQ